MAKRAKTTKGAKTRIYISALPAEAYDDSLDYVNLWETMNNFSQQGAAPQEDDVTVFASDGREKELGLPDNGTATISGFLKVGDEAQDVLREAEINKEHYSFSVGFSDGTGCRFLASVGQTSIGDEVNGRVSFTASITITGSLEWLKTWTKPTSVSAGEIPGDNP